MRFESLDQNGDIGAALRYRSLSPNRAKDFLDRYSIDIPAAVITKRTETVQF